jgi:hypothetical protein
MGCYVYYREANEKEREEYEARVAAATQRAEAKNELEKLAAHVQETGTRPAERQVLGDERIISTANMYGGGDWWVIQEQEGRIWYIRNNGMDGDDWAGNNITTGGAGAIGWYVPYTTELAEKLLDLEQTINSRYQAAGS